MQITIFTNIRDMIQSLSLFFCSQNCDHIDFYKYSNELLKLIIVCYSVLVYRYIIAFVILNDLSKI